MMHLFVRDHWVRSEKTTSFPIACGFHLKGKAINFLISLSP